jgi:hypothetical protein
VIDLDQSFLIDIMPWYSSHLRAPFVTFLSKILSKPSESSAFEKNPNSASPSKDFSGKIPTTQRTIGEIEGLARQLLGQMGNLEALNELELTLSIEGALDASNGKNKQRELLDEVDKKHSALNSLANQMEDGMGELMKFLQDMRERQNARGGAQ